MNDEFYDPNSHIDPAIRYEACQYSLSAFSRARVPAHEVDTGAPNSFMLGRVGNQSYLVYVRVTLDEEHADGTGPIPGILLDTAREMNATPRVVRVHLRSDHTGTSIAYFGHDELTSEFKRAESWRRGLLHGRTAQDYLKLVKGRFSRLELTVYNSRNQPPPEPAENENVIQATVGEDDPIEDHIAPPVIGLRLRVNTLTPQSDRYTIGIRQLVRSAAESDEFYIFTCRCGMPECVGIYRGIEVVHEDRLVVWRMRGLRPRRIVVFDRDQYRSEILSKVREAIALHRKFGDKAVFGADECSKRVSEALYYAEDTTV